MATLPAAPLGIHVLPKSTLGMPTSHYQKYVNAVTIRVACLQYLVN